MIATIKGEVISKGENNLIIEIGGIGIRVYVTIEVHGKVRLGDEISLHSYLVVREASLTLYGFEHEEERDLYILLLGVNGIGPRIALAVLSTFSVDVVRRAVWNEQPEVLSRVPGIGKKTAQRVVLHLQDRLGKVPILEDSRVLDVNTEVLEALTGLGYSIIEAQSALQSLPKDTPMDVEERLRRALRYFSG